MNVYIYNCPNTFNYGSMMMGENFISYFNEATGVENNYYVETMDEINIQRLINSTGSKKINRVKANALFHAGLNKYDYVLSQMRLKKVVSDFAKWIDLVVVLGGDDFTEDYGWKGPLLYAIQFNQLKREGIKIVMLSQTMGPYRSFRKPVMKRLLGRLDKIYPRDPLTYKYLSGLGLKNISLTDDLALLPLAKQETKERTGEYITYCPSELIYRYAKEGSRESWIQFNLFMADVIMERYPDKRLILLAHVLRPEQADDRIIVNEIYDLLKEKYQDRIIAVNSAIYPYEVRNYIQQSLFVISGRMHPVVSAIQCEIPAIALSYSTKFWGIIGERYGLGEYIIDVRQLNYIEMKEKFLHLMYKLETNYGQIQEKMKNNNFLASESILGTLKEMGDLESAVRR